LKRINLTIEGCADCPFLRFDDGKTREQDAGWDCSLAGNRRVVDEGDHWDFTESEPGEPGEELPTTLEPVMRAAGIHMYPDWCPLPEFE